ncbi:ribonuclease H-like domain-containing protein [Tanacetum coccineum]
MYVAFKVSVHLLIYVDDIVLTASSTALLQKIIFSLHREFDMKDLGAINYILEISGSSLVAYSDADLAGFPATRRSTSRPLLTATLVYCDNVSAVYLSANPVQHQRTKHIKIDIHLVCDMVATGHMRVIYVPSRYQYADIFTKGLPSALFEEFCTRLSVRLSPTQTAGEC